MTSWSPGSSSATRMRMGSAPRRRRTDGPHRLLQPQGEDRAGLGEGSQPEDARPALGGVLSGHGIHHPRGPQPADMGVGGSESSWPGAYRSSPVDLVTS